MKLSLIFNTCNRYNETLTTLASFLVNNPAYRDQFLSLIHVDDASDDIKCRAITQPYGFEQIGPMTKRLGSQASRARGIRHAAAQGATHVLILENDWESDRPLPWDLIRFAFSNPSFYHLRLYGMYRERDPHTGEPRRPVGRKVPGGGVEEPGWIVDPDAPEVAEIAQHVWWGAPPAITRIGEALWLHENTTKERNSRDRSLELGLYTMRPVKNVFWHIGYNTTEGFIP